MNYSMHPLPSNAPALVLANPVRHHREYRADLIVYGINVGYVERAQSGKGGGFHASDYRAMVQGIVVGAGRTLADLRDDLYEWIADERKMEADAVWLRVARGVDV